MGLFIDIWSPNLDPQSFSFNSKLQRSSASLLTIKQRQDETLRSYTKRFNIANSEVGDPNDKISLSAFKAGLTNETINLVLASANVITLHAAVKFLQNMEEEEETRKGYQKIGDVQTEENHDRKDRKPAQRIEWVERIVRLGERDPR